MTYARKRMKIKTHILYIIIIIVLVVLLVRPFAKSDKVGEFDNSITDTLSFNSDTTTFSKVDTLEQNSDSVKIVYVEKIVKDTIYVKDTTTNSSFSLQVVQKYFSEPDKYDLWISGVEPLNVDRICTYNQIEEKIITNTITEAIYPPKRNEFYLGGGFCSILDTFTPVMNASLKTKKNTLISLNLGYYKGSPLVMGTYSWKIGKNK